MVKKIEPWFGFTEDKVFGMVMENKDFCKYLLEIIIPDLKIRTIDWLDEQVEINNPERKSDAKEVRLDVLVTDHEGRVFNIEMQTTDQDDIGRRMRYYLSRLDLRYTLNKGKTYRNLKDAYIIFLCNFKPKKDDKFYESYHTYSDQDRSKQLQDGVTKIIINSQVSAEGQSEDLKALAKLMNNEPVRLNKHFDYAQRRIKEINEDPEMREKIMLYETRMLEREQAAAKIAGKVAYAEGRKDGVKQGKVDSAKVILENQMDNGSTLEQATEFVRNLKLIPNEELEKIVAMYK
ncbi:Rpn family recombination-promoting nuclease/putative transposase [Lactobacillus gasseri]|uniref:Rpn family recombination-promoting nuclease/putative transposase n=1 Tax=Lactobacillus gasseri TaxID=1596 RepID=UPI0029C13157|nr:Rpn family recombination-promoting nuclease/putative transposase [Lactobacillus gasseri]MDX5066441.1 Rpn family recombination-promoting nuclease/putative transposase [Lactobacillus gasseri]MDX5083147.1 Rpn family recombination-promoting nuclease/putative transposase [Lactobacillus gasseri]